MIYAFYDNYSLINGRKLLESFCEHYIKKHLDTTATEECVNALKYEKANVQLRKNTSAVLEHMS